MTPEQQNIVREIVRQELSGFLASDRYTFSKNLQIIDGRNIQLGNTTGTKIGSTTTQKIGFLGATPIGKQNIPFPVAAVDLFTALTAFGLTFHQ